MPDSTAAARPGARIRALRRTRKMTVNELALKAGVSVGMISQVERGIANPSLRTLERLRMALDVPLSDLLETDEEEAQPSAEHDFVRRAAQRPHFSVGPLNKQLLTPHGKHDIQFMIIEIPPHTSADEVLIGPGEKAGLVLDGQLTLGVGSQQARLEAGDSFQFDSTQTHFLRNETETAANVLWIMNTRMPVSYI
ncbi:MAG: XRE family transcriptional regulator [Corticimicrobacter sp.]|uniref:HTH cro/C1-type domain-containing protein n=1 Tax=Corticimicrobacter populi TaxID=2175229 RepID=A0A2V1JTR2_9BURK|nr:XRE family transcriptional regulator [Corticimicrobacter populi]PWF21264.1 hypothetical protein DD235_15750 [Corticimicrobacter populi]QDQ88763.1 helix-turn-helix domain-containing protein [Alcaligenaceae bacterium SJ-26]